jgi:hypothetical protein
MRRKKLNGKTWDDVWDEVETALETADSIAFDSCHKIYVLGDLEQTEKMVGYEYAFVEGVTNTADALATLKKWFEQSCGLKFIEQVCSEADGTESWHTLIPQGFFEACEDCGDPDCEGVCADFEDDEEDDF